MAKATVTPLASALSSPTPIPHTRYESPRRADCDNSTNSGQTGRRWLEGAAPGLSRTDHRDCLQRPFPTSWPQSRPPLLLSPGALSVQGQVSEAMMSEEDERIEVLQDLENGGDLDDALERALCSLQHAQALSQPGLYECEYMFGYEHDHPLDYSFAYARTSTNGAEVAEQERTQELQRLFNAELGSELNTPLSTNTWECTRPTTTAASSPRPTPEAQSPLLPSGDPRLSALYTVMQEPTEMIESSLPPSPLPPLPLRPSPSPSPLLQSYRSSPLQGRGVLGPNPKLIMPQTQEYHLREEDMPTPVTPLPSLSCIFEHAAVQDEAEDSHSGRVCDQEIEEDEDEETYDDDRLLEQDHQHPERPIRESQIDRPRCHSLAAQSSIAAPDRPQSRLLASTKQPQDVKGNSTITPSAATLRKSRSAHVYFLDYYIDLLSYLKNKRERLQEFKKRPQLRRLSAEQSNSAWKEFSLQETKILRQRRTRARAIQFQILTQVGQGGFGEVFLARKTDTNELCALKRMSKRHLHLQDEVQHILTERDVLTATRSEWHVKLLYSFQDRDHVYLAMEFVPGGDIRTMLTARGVLREDETRLYFAEMVLAIDALHQQGYIHRDLKPENFLIDRTGHIKLTDFGLSKGQLAESRIAVMQAKLNEVKNSMEPTMPTLRRSGGSSILMPLTTLQGLEGAENVYSGTGAGSMLQGHLKLGAGGSFASLNGLLHRSPSHLLWNGSSSSLVPLANNSLLNLHAQAQGVNANQPGLQQQQQQQTEPHRNEGIRRAYSIVGSADYMAPEILASKGYDYGVDYWSLGCILFEFLSGYSPFQAEDTRQTCVNVWHWWKVLKRPVYDTEENLEFNLTDEAWDLTTKLIADREDRYTTVQQVKRHPWFKGLDWNNLRSMDTLFVPVLSSPIDTSYFDDFSNPEDMAGYRDVMLRQAQVHDAVLAADARSGKGAEEGPCGAEPLSLERKGLGQGGEVLNQSSGALPYILQAQEPWKGAFVGFTFRHQHPQSIIA